MMTQQLGVSIIAAPLSAIDRRTLSQAWYTALRIGKHSEPLAASPALRLHYGCLSSSPHVLSQNSSETAHHASVMTSSSHRASATISKHAEGLAPKSHGRLVTRCALAAQIERAFSRPRAYPKRATLSIGRGRARVHVILQTCGAKATLLAICRPEMREIVARALAQARVVLASRGVVQS
jgi:hypothetical protein